MKQILLATTNKGKLKEFQSILKDLPIKIVSLDDIDPTLITKIDVKETGDTFEENAIIKATIYGKATKLITICDDSGLVVDALDGKPGVHSKRFGPTDKARNNKLLTKLEGVPDSKRSARFVCVIAIYDPTTNKIITTHGTCEGHITHQPQGQNGFGYDPVFYSRELKKTFAQCNSKEKNQVSHRGKALNKAKKLIHDVLLL